MELRSRHSRLLTRRGHYLLIFGLVYAVIGYALLTAEAPTQAVNIAINRIVPPPIYGTASLLVGAYSAVVAWHRKASSWTTTAFVLLSVLFVFRAIAHVYAGFEVVSAIEQAPIALLWLGFVWLHVIVAGWTDPTETRVISPSKLDEEVVSAMSEAMVQLHERNEALATENRHLKEVWIRGLAE